MEELIKKILKGGIPMADSKKALIYVRSYDASDISLSVDASLLEKVAAKLGFTQVAVCRDTSLLHRNRKALKQAACQVKDGGFSAVLTFNPKVLTHNRHCLYNFMKELQDCGAKLICTNSFERYLYEIGLYAKLRKRAARKNLCLPWDEFNTELMFSDSELSIRKTKER